MLEKELRKAFEQTTTSNVQGILDHSNDTRKMLREVEEKIKCLENIVFTQNSLIDTLRLQLSSVQAKLYVGGTV